MYSGFVVALLLQKFVIMASTIKLAVMKLLQRLDYRLSTTISSHNKSTVTDSENLIPETIEVGDLRIYFLWNEVSLYEDRS
jgi:hypothetical protein